MSDIDRDDFIMWINSQRSRICKTVRLARESGDTHLFLMVDPFVLQLGFWHAPDIDDYWPHMLVTGIELPEFDYTVRPWSPHRDWQSITEETDCLIAGILNQFDETHGDHITLDIHDEV